MLTAAEVIDPEVAQWAINLAIGGALSALVFLVKKTFSDVGDKLDSHGSKLEAIVAAMAQHDTRLSVLETKLEAMADDVIGLRESRHRQGDAITSLQARLINRTTSGSFPKVGDDE